MTEGVVGEMDILGVTESYLVKRQVLLSAAEAAEMILRVDNIIRAAPRFILFLFIFHLFMLENVFLIIIIEFI
jgi:hypothetical protein